MCKFREISEMSDAEVRICMSLILEDSIISNIKRNPIQNTIDVEFTILGYKEKTYKISLLPDEFNIENIPGRIHLKTNGLYLYKQFMIAKGYSEYWKDNIFV